MKSDDIKSSKLREKLEAFVRYKRYKKAQKKKNSSNLFKTTMTWSQILFSLMFIIVSFLVFSTYIYHNMTHKQTDGAMLKKYWTWYKNSTENELKFSNWLVSDK